MREYDLDEILAEFGSDPLWDDPLPEEEAASEFEAAPEENPAMPFEQSAFSPPSEEPEYEAMSEPVFEPVEEAVFEPDYEPEYIPEAEDPAAEPVFEPDEDPEPEEDDVRPSKKSLKAGKNGKPKKAEKAGKTSKPDGPTKTVRLKKESFGTKLGFALASLVFMLVSLLVLTWSLGHIHPDSSVSAGASKGTAVIDLVSRLDSGMNNSKANALSDITYIPKHYSIPEGVTVAPRPNESAYGSVSPDNASAVMDIVARARDAGLLEGQDLIFSPDLNFRSDTPIQYYYDETILSIIWKEIIDGNTVTCCEVKIADASQFRRKLVDDSFGSPTKLFATSLAASVNSVVAMNADFYMFRDFGIVVYDHELYRFGQDTYTGSYRKYNCTDTLFINDQGDFLFWHRLQEATPEEMRAFIAENNIVFSIAFGPILVENGEYQYCDWYPAGEIDRGYSRAGIGQAGHLHYFYMSLNHSEVEARWTVNKFGEKMHQRGLQQAYCLDGGQTSEIVWRGSPFNYIDFGGEREVSDIIYFATAIPESEGRS